MTELLLIALLCFSFGELVGYMTGYSDCDRNETDKTIWHIFIFLLSLTIIYTVYV